MGGGTGTFPVISAIRSFPLDISTIIAVSDSGGSTGKIRDEFGFQAVGDLRQSLAALADPESQLWIQQLLLYRFQKGSGLKGHNLGNLILTALQDLTGDTTKALEIAEKTFALNGQVIPVTTKNVDLVIHYDDGSSVVGEHTLDIDTTKPKKITKVELSPKCRLNKKAAKAIKVADFIIIGPGDLYASLMAVLSVPGVSGAFQKSKAKVIYISNLMTRITQTHDLTAKGHLEKIEEAIKHKVDNVLINSEPIPDKTLEIYVTQHEFPVLDDFSIKNKRVVRAELLSQNNFKKNYRDNTHRSLLRHDADKLKQALKKIIND